MAILAEVEESWGEEGLDAGPQRRRIQLIIRARATIHFIGSYAGPPRR